MSFLVPHTGSVHRRIRLAGGEWSFRDPCTLRVCTWIHTHAHTDTHITQVISVPALRSLAPQPVPGGVTQVGSFWDGKSWEAGNYLQVLTEVKLSAGEIEEQSRELQSSSMLSSHHQQHPRSLQTTEKRCPGSHPYDIPGQVTSHPQQQTLPLTPPSTPSITALHWPRTF